MECPVCKVSGESITRNIDGENVRKCTECDHIYSRHPMNCKCKFCYCSMCFLHFMENLRPEDSNLANCQMCGTKWYKPDNFITIMLNNHLKNSLKNSLKNFLYSIVESLS